MLKSIVAVTALVVSSASASASIIQYDFPMDGIQEVPPVATPATGQCTVLLNDVSGDVNVNCTFQDLLGSSTAAHIHGPAPIGTNAGVILSLTASPGTSGTITGAGTLSAPNMGHMLAGNTYVNLHSQFRPGGEIRGQVTPEPATAVLVGLGGLLMLRRRR